MDKQTFVVFKKQQGEVTNAYSVVGKDTFHTIPSAIVLATKEVEDKLYSKEELEALRDELVKEKE